MIIIIYLDAHSDHFPFLARASEISFRDDQLHPSPADLVWLCAASVGPWRAGFDEHRGAWIAFEDETDATLFAVRG